MRRREGLVRVARRVAAVLGPDDCLLVGGLAVGAHGYVRATRDVDLVTRLPLREAKKRLAEAGIPCELARRDVIVIEGDVPCLQAHSGGVRIDVMPPLVEIEWERGIELPPPSRLRVVDLLGLLRLKMRAQGPKDLADAAALILRHPEIRKRASELAVAYRVAEKLEVWLEDRRLQAEIDASAAEEGSPRRARPALRKGRR